MTFERKSVEIEKMPAGDGGDGARRRWFETRRAKEGNFSLMRQGVNVSERSFDLPALAIGALLKAIGLDERGRRNAETLHLRECALPCAGLPAPFEGYRILHFTDPHFGNMEGTKERLIERITGLNVDLCVLTGDYRAGFYAPPQPLVDTLAEVVGNVETVDGVYATLGNHDSADMVAPLEAAGIKVLCNETVNIRRDGWEFLLTGVDDIYAFYTPEADAAVQTPPADLKILLSHSPEFAPVGAAAGYQVCFSGHTHGGQISLPGGWPVITHMRKHRRLGRAGVNRFGDMHVVTNAGVGISLVPYRFFTRSEVVLATLTGRPQAS